MSQFTHLQTNSRPIQELLDRLKVPGEAFEDKVVLITGGARGLGQQLVLGFGYLRAHVYFVDKRAKEGHELEKICEKLGYKAKFLNIDITKQDLILAKVQEILQLHGRVDFLINNAVHFVTKDVLSFSMEEWEYSHQTNVVAPLLLNKTLLPGMLERNSGQIVHLIAVEGMAHAACMSSSKASFRSLMISMAAEIPENSDVCIMGYAPGLVDTPLVFENFPVYCEKLGYDFTDYVLNITNNPGYPGLIPAADSAASLICNMALGKENHGFVCTPYLHLHKGGIIDIKEELKKQVHQKRDNIEQTNEYIIEIDKYQKDIEKKIELRTEELQKEKERTRGLLDHQREYTARLENLKEQLENQNRELMDAKEKAEKASVAKANFLSTMSHEIRTPLNAVIGLVNILLDDDPREDQIENLNTLKFSGDNLLGIINDILDFSKIENNKIDLETVEFSLFELLKGLEHSHGYVAREKGIELHVQHEGSIPDIIIGDPTRLSQILNNLLGNALKFTNAGHVKLSVCASEIDEQRAQLTFAVSDTGIGISPDQLESIFDSFSQESTSITRRFGGTGLGLTITRSLTEIMGGRIEVESVKDEGSEFKVIIGFEIPENAIDKDDIVRRYSSRSLDGLKVLLVEDNPINVLVARQFLEAWKIETDIAENGAEALSCLKSKDYHLILMDLQMPIMDGYEATRLIRDEDWDKSELPIIALSASAMSETRKHAFEQGFTDFVTKPFTPNELFNKIKKHTSHFVL